MSQKGSKAGSVGRRGYKSLQVLVALCSGLSCQYLYNLGPKTRARRRAHLLSISREKLLSYTTSFCRPGLQLTCHLQTSTPSSSSIIAAKSASPVLLKPQLPNVYPAKSTDPFVPTATEDMKSSSAVPSFNPTDQITPQSKWSP